MKHAFYLSLMLMYLTLMFLYLTFVSTYLILVSHFCLFLMDIWKRKKNMDSILCLWQHILYICLISIFLIFLKIFYTCFDLFDICIYLPYTCVDLSYTCAVYPIPISIFLLLVKEKCMYNNIINPISPNFGCLFEQFYFDEQMVYLNKKSFGWFFYERHTKLQEFLYHFQTPGLNFKLYIKMQVCSVCLKYTNLTRPILWI